MDDPDARPRSRDRGARGLHRIRRAASRGVALARRRRAREHSAGALRARHRRRHGVRPGGHRQPRRRRSGARRRGRDGLDPRYPAMPPVLQQLSSVVPEMRSCASSSAIRRGARRCDAFDARTFGRAFADLYRAIRPRRGGGTMSVGTRRAGGSASRPNRVRRPRPGDSPSCS